MDPYHECEYTEQGGPLVMPDTGSEHIEPPEPWPRPPARKEPESIAEAEDHPCQQCQGSGMVYEDGKTHYMYSNAAKTVCPTCGGSGHAEPERHVLATGWPIDGALRLEPDGAQRPAIPNWPDNLSGRYRLILERAE